LNTLKDVCTALVVLTVHDTGAHDTKSYPNNYRDYTGPQVIKAMTTVPFQNTISSYEEMRRYGFDYALDALPDEHPLKSDMIAAMAATRPPLAPPNPNLEGYPCIVFSTKKIIGLCTLFLKNLQVPARGIWGQIHHAPFCRGV
jgi:hypothetical protein